MERGRTGHVAWLRTSPVVDVLFLHGYSDSAETWLPLFPSLGSEVGLAAVDARGHGLSGLPDSPFGMEALAEETAAVLDAFGSRPVIVVGTSMGGLTAAVLASTRPDLVRSLVLVEPALGARQRSAPSMPVPDWVREVKALSREEKVEWCRSEHPLWPEDELVPWAVAKEQLDVRLHAQPWADPVSLADCLARVRCPARLVLGEVSCGSMVDEAAVRSLGVPFVRLAGAGHAAHRDQRAAFVQAFRSVT